jgi:hypothetical protein
MDRRFFMTGVSAALLLCTPIAEAKGKRGGGGRRGGGNKGGCGSRGGAGFRKSNGKCADKNGK